MKKYLSAIAAAGLLSQSANATILDFETGSIVGGMMGSYVEDDFRISSDFGPVAPFDIFGPSFAAGSDGNIFGWCGGQCQDADSPQVISLTSIDGSAFNLLSVDFASLFEPSGEVKLSVHGLFEAGGEISQVVEQTGAFATTDFTGFTGLSAVEFRVFGDSDDPAMDNIRLAYAPAPQTLALLLVGLVGVFARKRVS
ncbi:hypothetical protein [Aliagarivorans marinus]|uniref:hypothetical protein n=1 Tax=Aliagarivorans marinus TaxID=561965 RepID=UPI0004258BF3|nr:hypothetical protein [Aliagarivorans marinus]